jgi:hypothetical protein
MSEERRVVRRRGLACNLTLDVDAHALMKELSPHAKSYGRFLSELVRAEALRREERQKAREAAVKAVEAALCP